jgi:hypothetical protein
LGDVDAVSSNDVWAVGGVGLGTLVERWNGSAWSVVPSPNLPAGGGYFSAVSALSSTDIWAVGSTIDGLLVHALIEHWDGSAWSIVPAPATGAELSLDAVTVVGPNDAWAVGFARQGQNYRPQILHWDGVAWAFSKLPKLPPNGTPGGGSGHLEHERVGGGERAERLRLLEDLDPSLGRPRLEPGSESESRWALSEQHPGGRHHPPDRRDVGSRARRADRALRAVTVQGGPM